MFQVQLVTLMCLPFSYVRGMSSTRTKLMYLGDNDASYVIIHIVIVYLSNIFKPERLILDGKIVCIGYQYSMQSIIDLTKNVYGVIFKEKFGRKSKLCSHIYKAKLT